MYIKLSELFIYRQYKAYPISFYFDRKTYTVVSSTFFCEHKYDEVYERFIPLFQIDEERIQDNFIREFNNKKLLRDYENKTVCFEAFARDCSIWRQWWDYYKKIVYQIASDWCRDNHIRYVDTDTQ